MTPLADPLDTAADRWRLPVRAVRGATTVAADEPALVRAATAELLEAMLRANALPASRVISAIFTVTPDLCSEFPARAARALGWTDVPLLCAQEIAVPGALPRCIRVLLHASSARPRARVRHVYLRDAVALRPDLATADAAERPAVTSAAVAAEAHRRRGRRGPRRRPDQASPSACETAAPDVGKGVGTYGARSARSARSPKGAGIGVARDEAVARRAPWSGAEAGEWRCDMAVARAEVVDDPRS